MPTKEEKLDARINKKIEQWQKEVGNFIVSTKPLYKKEIKKGNLLEKIKIKIALIRGERLKKRQKKIIDKCKKIHKKYDRPGQLPSVLIAMYNNSGQSFSGHMESLQNAKKELSSPNLGRSEEIPNPNLHNLATPPTKTSPKQNSDKLPKAIKKPRKKLRGEKPREKPKSTISL